MSNLDNQMLLDALKEQATELGISFHPNISLEKLSQRIKEHEVEQEAAAEAPKPKAKKTLKEHREEALKLVRVNVTCMNPAKNEWEGELFTVGNSVIETQTKFVPFNTTEGWHIPYIMYKLLRDRQCQVFYTAKVQGNDVRVGKQIKEFAIDVLPPLTEQERKELAVRQAMRAGQID